MCLVEYFMFRTTFWLKAFVLTSFTLLLAGCSSGSMPDFNTIITNIGNSIAPLWRLVTGAAYLFGFAFIFRGIFMLKTYGEARTMMSGQGNFKGALVCLFVSVALIFSQTMYQSLLLTTFNVSSTSPMEYPTSTTMDQQAYFSLLYFIQFIGLVSFIRGWVMLSHASNPGQQNSFGKALTHIAGGLLAINIQGTIDIVKGTIGMT